MITMKRTGELKVGDKIQFKSGIAEVTRIKADPSKKFRWNDVTSEHGMYDLTYRKENGAKIGVRVASHDKWNVIEGGAK